jgi:hypothetical protein
MKLQNIQEFELYALLYVAALDMKTSKEEQKLINAKMAGESFEHVEEMFEQDNDAQRVETIVQAAKEYLKTDEQRAEFMNDLKKMAAADSTTPFEAAALSLLENLLHP